MRDSSFYLPFCEWRRLRRAALFAQQRDQSEVCGLLCASHLKALSFVFLRNESDSGGSWRLSTSIIRSKALEAKQKGLHFLGLFHSHPISEAVPGAMDQRSISVRRWQLIYDVCGREARLWRRDSKGQIQEVGLKIERSRRRGFSNNDSAAQFD